MPRPSKKQSAPKRRPSAPRTKAVPSDDQSLWLRAVFQHSALGIARLDRSARILDANAAFERFFDRAMTELRGRAIGEFAAAEDAASIIAMVAEASGGCDQSATREARFVRPDGKLAWGSLMLSCATETRDLGMIAVVQDVSERKALEAELLHQAFHDSLTGLANRALFRDRVDHALARSSREAECVSVLFIDLDDFKSINDTQGHATGDVVLQRVASALLTATRGCDTVSRLGGDEFAVLLERVNHAEGPEVAAQRIVNALARPIETSAGRTVNVAVSIGIAIQRSGEDRDEVLRNADVALYEAKTNSRGRWVIYNPAMHAALVDKVSLEADLRVAIEKCLLVLRPGMEKTGRFPRFGGPASQSQLWLAYQPIVEMESEQLTGFEALLRWSHPERGVIMPASFIPIAEETGLVIALGRWVLRTACLQAASWNRRRLDAPLTVTVNLSGRQLQDDSLAIDVESALRESGLPASQLVLEMTESVIMHESAARKRLHELKQLRVRIAIDDFGTGYSSLSHLQQFPVDILKIDQSFLHRMHQGPQDLALVKTIITLAKLLSLRTIAEGVEDAEQQMRLRELGCDSAQGFLFGKPMPVQDIDNLLSVTSDSRR